MTSEVTEKKARRNAKRNDTGMSGKKWEK